MIKNSNGKDATVEMVTYYMIQLRYMDSVPHFLAPQEYGDDLFVSANTKMAGIYGAGCFDSETLAESFAEAILPIVRKRRGDGVELDVVEGGSKAYPEILEKIKKDSQIALTRLRTGNFSPNKKVE